MKRDYPEHTIRFESAMHHPPPPWVQSTSAAGGVDVPTLGNLQAALAHSSYAYTSGKTHNFYLYPARFSPEVARSVIASFSKPGEWVLDPFMGGGTSIIEGLALGRRMIGMDLNALAWFVARVRTRPLSEFDQEQLRRWAALVSVMLAAPGPELGWVERPGVRNLPGAVEAFIAGALQLSVGMAPRQRAFARCVLLRLGQWALDCGTQTSRQRSMPRRREMSNRLPRLLEEMFEGMRSFEAACLENGISRGEIRRNRILLHRNAVGFDNDPALRFVRERPALAFCSPPYPAVNVLYHRWQYRGRKETPAPYWIASVPDGCGASFYCGGSRTPTGLKNYFEMIERVFQSVARVLAPRGHLVQVVGFSNVSQQLPLYLETLRRSGFDEVVTEARLSRRVPNRKWYTKLKGHVDASSEFLLIHRLAQ